MVTANGSWKDEGSYTVTHSDKHCFCTGKDPFNSWLNIPKEVGGGKLFTFGPLHFDTVGEID